MQALGLIETYGMLAAVEAADVMLKTAEVTLLEKERVGGGRVTVMVSGDVAAVRSAVDAAQGAVRQLGETLLLSAHVIPRADISISLLLQKVEPAVEIVLSAVAEDMRLKETAGECGKEIKDNKGNTDKVGNPPAQPEMLCKAALDALYRRGGPQALTAFLQKEKVVRLRRLVREYPGLPIAGRGISKADKAQLMAVLQAYYREGVI